MMIQFATSELPPWARNGVVRPVSGMSRVTPPMTMKHCSAIVKLTPVAKSLPNPSREAEAIFMPRSNRSTYSSRRANSPIMPSSSPSDAKMKSEFA